MSKLEMRIHLEGGKRDYTGGDLVAGAVYVMAREPVDCRSLTVELLWQAHGKGNRNVQTIDSQVEGEQRWEPGFEQRFPFRFQLPKSPWTYHGHLLNVDYHLCARADFPWARDAVVEEEIVVLPGAPPEGEAQAKWDQEGPLSAPKSVRKSALASLTGSAVMVLLLLALAFLFTPIFLILVLIVAIRAVRTVISERRLGKVQVSLEPLRVSPGRSVQAQVWFPKTERVEVRSICATVTGEEICQSQTGRNRRTYKHTLHKDVVALEPSGHNEFCGELRLPDTDAYTFKSKDNEIAWQITVHVDISNWPDWQRVYPVTVAPQFSDALDGQSP